MKKIFLALLALAVMVGCSDNLDWPSKIEQKYNFAFDAEGVCYSKNIEGITHAEFAEKVVGYGWKMLSGFVIFENGQVSKEELQLDGIYISKCYFETEKIFKHFHSHTMSFTGDRLYVYRNKDYVFDDSKIYFGDDYTYLILSIKEDTMECIWLYGRDRYAFVTMKRMTQEELNAHLQKHSLDYDVDIPALGRPTSYDFRFNSEGECYSQNLNGIDANTFVNELQNSGWKQLELYKIMDNGNVEFANYWDDRIGGGSRHFYVDGTALTQYISSSAYPPGEDKGYCNYDYTFEDSAIRINTTMNIENNNIPMYRILKLNVDYLICIEFIGVSGDENKKVFGLAAYKRMTPEELEKVQQTYTRNWSEVE